MGSGATGTNPITGEPVPAGENRRVYITVLRADHYALLRWKPAVSDHYMSEVDTASYEYAAGLRALPDHTQCLNGGDLHMYNSGDVHNAVVASATQVPPVASHLLCLLVQSVLIAAAPHERRFCINGCSGRTLAC